MNVYMECPICGPASHRVLRDGAEKVAWCQDCKRARTMSALETGTAQSLARWDFGAEPYARGRRGKSPPA